MRQQMRWSPIGAHLLAQVRCAVINGDLVQDLRDMSHHGNHCRAKLPSSWRSSGWHRSSYNPKVFNAPLTTTSLYLHVDDDRRHHETDEKHRIDW